MSCDHGVAYSVYMSGGAMDNPRIICGYPEFKVLPHLMELRILD